MSKTYRAIRHDITRSLQRENASILHHPNEKINQIKSYIDLLPSDKKIKTLELFGGYGNLSKVYSEFSKTTVIEKDRKKVEYLLNLSEGLNVINGDSFKEIHRFIYDNKKFNIVDADPYGFPNRLFPHLYLLIEEGLLFVTMPKPYVNILNNITQTHLYTYYEDTNPSIDCILSKFVTWGLCHWRKVEVLDCLDLKSVWRICFYVTKVKATEYTGTKNRADKIDDNTKKVVKNTQLNLF